METRIYEETPLKIAVRLCVGIVAFFIVVAFFVSFLPSHPMTPNAKLGGAVGIGLALTVIFGTLLIAWLVIKKRKVIVDYKGVEVFAKRPLGKTETAQVSWKDITAVDIESLSGRVKNSNITSYKLSIIANGQRVYLMANTFYDLNFSSLVRDVGKATTHLGYVWETCKASETRPILDSVPPFCKVSLLPQIVANQQFVETQKVISERKSDGDLLENKEIERQRNKAMLFRLAVFSPIILMLIFSSFLKFYLVPFYAYYFGYLLVAAIIFGIHSFILQRKG